VAGRKEVGEICNGGGYDVSWSRKWSRLVKRLILRHGFGEGRVPRRNIPFQRARV
jgi:hypothetical protein